MSMNSRQRFLETMSFGSPDRVPLFQEGMREDVLDSWMKQGLISKKYLSQLFLYDAWEEIAPDLYPRSALKSIPKSKADLDRLQSCLDPHDPRRLPKRWKAKVRAWRKREHVLLLRVHEGFFLSLGVEGWRRFSEVMQLVMDDPKRIQEWMAIQGEFAAALADGILRQVEVDAAIFGEPISSIHGPLISPQMYKAFVLSNYEPVLDVLEKHDVGTIILRTYANSRALLPSVMKTRINCLWACECGTESMDYRTLRETYGKDLRLIGGIDTDVLLQDQDAIRHEVEDKVASLLFSGGYIPLADGRIRKPITFENYKYYRQLLEEIVFRDPE
jgi:hypothetical protein